MELNVSSSQDGADDLTALVGEEDWSSTTTLTPADQEKLFSLLECAICVTFLQDAHECPTCHQLFCRACIAGWLQSKKSCPCCRGALDVPQLARNVVVQRFLDSMTQECPNSGSGCAARPSRSEVGAHLATCAHRPEVLATRRSEARAVLLQRVARLEQAFARNTMALDEAVAVARDLIAAGDAVAALQLAERAKAKFPQAAAADDVVADALYAGGQWARALPIYKARQSHRAAANCELKLGQYDACEASLLAALRSGTGAGGADEVATLCSLGALKKKQSAYSDAQRYLADALKLVPVGGKPWIEASMSLADCLRKTEKYEEAKKLYIQVLKRSEVEFGKRSAQVADCLNALGIITKKLGLYPAAIKFIKAAIKLKVSLANGDFNNSEIGIFLANLGDVHRKESNYGQAEALYARALQIFAATIGPNHIENADVLNSVGLVKKKFAQYDEAAALYDRAIAICRDTFRDKPSYKLGIYLNNRADIERKRGIYDGALRMYDESLTVLRATVGAMHSECADPIHARGLVLHQQGKYAEALDSIQQACKIVEREFGATHYKMGVFLSSSGLARAMVQDIDGAYKDLKSALQILIAALGPSHVEVADVYSALADVCLKLYTEGKREPERLQEAKKYVERARAICVEKFSPNHTKTQQCDSLLFIIDNVSSLM